MGLFERLFAGHGHDLADWARRMGIDPRDLLRLQPRYREFTVPKRSGGNRRIHAPESDLKRLQRLLLRRVLARLQAHPAATGFERGRSIVTNARAHQGQAVVLRFDLVDFFPSTRAKRVKAYFRRIGWNRRATRILLRLTTHINGLPQGAPSSPRLSNLVNYRLDARLAAMTTRFGGVYTRYADDLTVSFREEDANKIHYVKQFVREVVEAEGYRLHARKKQSIRRRHHRQLVTGLVVNDRVNLPRSTRRWLRAVEHRARLAQETSPASRGQTHKRPTLDPAQLEGWRALQSMIARQSESGWQPPAEPVP